MLAIPLLVSGFAPALVQDHVIRLHSVEQCIITHHNGHVWSSRRRCMSRPGSRLSRLSPGVDYPVYSFSHSHEKEEPRLRAKIFSPALDEPQVP